MRLLEPQGETGLTVAAIGDIGVIGTGRARARRDGYDSALVPLRPALEGSDLVFGNLEMPVGEPSWVEPGRSPEFHHDADLIPALRRLGLRLVSLANNHILDCGARGLDRTREACEAAGLVCFGAGRNLDEARRPARLEVAGRSVVALGYASAGTQSAAGANRPGPAPLDRDRIAEDLAEWRPRCDLLLVSVHWGSMYVDYPPPRVLELAALLESSGVDLVLGHHPHVTQGFRRRGRTLTLFSLGDAIFNSASGDFRSSVGAETRRMAGVFTARLAESPGLDYAAFQLDADGFPHPAGVEQQTAHRSRLERISGGLEEGARRFHDEAAPDLLRYELESIGHWLRRGQLDRIAGLIGTIRPRHLKLLWRALRARGRSA